MGGRIVREGHACDTPPTDRTPPETVWQCDCGRYWFLKAAGIAVGQRARWIRIGPMDLITLRLADNLAASQRRPQDGDNQ